MIFGRVGDHKVRVIEKGTKHGHYPILEFAGTNKTSAGPSVHRIIYRPGEYDIPNNLPKVKQNKKINSASKTRLEADISSFRK